MTGKVNSSNYSFIMAAVNGRDFVLKGDVRNCKYGQVWGSLTRTKMWRLNDWVILSTKLQLLFVRHFWSVVVGIGKKYQEMVGVHWPVSGVVSSTILTDGLQWLNLFEYINCDSDGKVSKYKEHHNWTR